MSTLEDKKRQQVYINKAKEKEKEYNIPENMLVGLLKTESGFREDVIQGRTKSSAGAIGIAQFMPNTAKEYGIDPLNVDQAIDGAARYLSRSYKTLGNWDDAIRSYNMGVGGVQAWKSGRKKLPKETFDYLPKVYKNAGLDYKYDTTIQSQQEQTNFDPTHYNNITKPLNNLPETNVNTTFAGVPNVDLPQEKTEEEQTDKDIAELQTKTAEQNFLEELYQNREIVEQPQPQQQRTQAQPVDYMQMYEQVSNFVDTPLIGGEEAMQQGGKKKTIYVDSKNDPRYRAYKDSLDLYKESSNNFNKNVKMLPKNKIYNYVDKEDAKIDAKNKNILPVKAVVFSNEAGNYRVNTPIYKKPTQPVEVRPNTFKDSKGNTVTTGDNKPNFSRNQLVQVLQKVEVKPREKLIPFNYDLELRGIQQNSLEPSSDLTITPQAQIPRYYNITDKVNQNFGGGETKYRWNPNQGELSNISEETYPDGTPYNERKIEPVYQQGGTKTNKMNEVVFNMMQRGATTEQIINQLIRMSVPRNIAMQVVQKAFRKPIEFNQQGGQYTENELAFLSEIAIKDQEGQRKFPNQITEIQGDTMATNGYGNIPLYVIPDKGKPKVVQANTGEHKFKGATKFIEIPLFKK